MTNTQQSEALQAVRLLYTAAYGGGSSDHKNPEMLFRARVLLEGFILGEQPDTPLLLETWYKGAAFRVCEYVNMPFGTALAKCPITAILDNGDSIAVLLPDGETRIMRTIALRDTIAGNGMGSKQCRE
jgi:hypothetical protein